MDARDTLLKGEGLAAYILMERIRPAVNTCALLRNGEWSIEETLTELGIYGGFVKKGDEVLLNEASGHLLRTKVWYGSAWFIIDAKFVNVIQWIVFFAKQGDRQNAFVARTWPQVILCSLAMCNSSFQKICT